MLTSIAWVKVRNMWKEMEERLKLGTLSEIAAIECESKLCSAAFVLFVTCTKYSI